MAPSDDPTNIRVFIHWHNQTVFAGEEVKCTITFKNVATGSDQQRQQQPPQSDRHRLTSSLQSRAKAGATLSPPSASHSGRGHKRSALSLSVPPSSSRSRSASVQWSAAGSATDSNTGHGPGHSHKRSVSIVSIGSATTVDDHSVRNESSSRQQRPRGGHGRAASLQIVPRAQQSPVAGPQSATLSPRQMSSPLFNGSYPPDRFRRTPSSLGGSNPPSAGGPRRSPRMSPNPMPDFRFPAAPSPTSDVTSKQNKASADSLLSPRSNGADTRDIPLRQRESVPGTSTDRPTPAARVLSSTSLMGGTPRSSGEFYSVSNNSSETLASEYVAQQPAKTHVRPPHFRKSSGLIPHHVRAPESLMMGYAQIQGTFSLDGSLVDLGPFELVKKKAAVGGRGGGVIGLEQTRRESGFLRGLGLGSIGSSLGDLWGGGELSTIKEMRGVANSKSIPLLSTPQSILFVDLKLGPGQSKAFDYTFRLPKGLPPSHKGKAMKISYSLVIGTQRVGGVKEQQVRSVETPFRVLGSVNSIGEILGHDLMSPYILLRDEAQVKSSGKDPKAHKNKAPSRAPATLNEFLLYADELASRPRDENNGTLLSPTAVMNPANNISAEQGASAQEAIHFAIMRSNVAGEGQQSPNRFEISRNGMRVGVVMLTRPSYRLGEVVTMAIDLTDAEIPCYAIHTTLETSERVDHSLAVRSESSIQRVTRKVYATASETTLYSRRVVFTPTIPIAATPEFLTSGVSLDWKIRVEFVVPSRGDAQDGEGPRPLAHSLLGQISQDEKGGLVLAAVENLASESFDIMVPLRVYGAVGSGLERLERDEASDEGLAV